ncbi:MAG: VOC family protein [Ignavibacteriaceae bacterium]
MLAVNPYLNFPGNTEEAFNFYKSVFGGDFPGIMRFKDMPGGEEVSAADKDKIMHMSIPLGKNNMLMATDALESMGQKVVFGNSVSIAITAESKEEADKLFNGLSAGGKVTMPMADQFWGDYFGDTTDKFGIHWMVVYTPDKK